MIHSKKYLDVQNGSWGHVKFFPYKRGAEKVLSHAEGGIQKFWGSFYAVSWKF